MRHHEHELIERAWAQAHTSAARRDRRRRRYLMAGSFAQAANLHHFKRARWRRLWRQQIQDWLIAACQNVRLFVRALGQGPLAMESRDRVQSARSLSSVSVQFHSFFAGLGSIIIPTFHALSCQC
jgi:nitroreductase